MDEHHLYRKESLEGLHSLEDLDRYVVTSRPWWWAIGVGLSLLIVSALAWLFLGHIPMTVTVTGVVTDSRHLTAYVEATQLTAHLQGAYANVSLQERRVSPARVVSLDQVPYSRAELKKQFSSDWLFFHLVSGQFMWRLEIQTEKEIPVGVETLCDVAIIVSDKRPIDYLLFGR